jgi:hypothetical protein
MAETAKIIPATTRAAPASKLNPELESFIDTHIKMPRIMDAPEIKISTACARKIQRRGGFNGIFVSVIHYVLKHSGYISL